MNLNYPSGALTNINGEELLKEITFNTEEALATFTETNEIASVLETAFGTNVATPQAALLTQNWLTGDLLEGLEADITLSSELDSASGAYATQQDTIYLSQKFLTQATVEEATDVLLEEIGHAIDAELNPSDSPGDEGAIFSSLVQGEALSQSELAQLRGEDDRATLEISGETLSVEQDTLTVTNTNNRGDGSLRDAISEANEESGSDTITFENNLMGKTIALTGEVLTINDSVTIQGLGMDQLTIDGAGNSGVFGITDFFNPNPVDVTIEGLTITGGQTSDTGSSGGAIFNEANLSLINSKISQNAASGFVSPYGGAIANKGNLTITNSEISGNSAESGGAIFNDEGTVTITNSEISNNETNTSLTSRSYGSGGGIVNKNGILNITRSTISGNSASNSSNNNDFFNDTSSPANGGGIANTGTSLITNSTISDNVADSGGGIANSSGELSLLNSTVSGNSASQINGGIINQSLDGDEKGTLTLTNTTVSDNSAELGGGVGNYNGSITVAQSTISGNSAEAGAGVYNYSGTTTLTNSIIANSSNAEDLVNTGTINTEGVNLVEDGSLTGTDIINEDPQLAPLQDNGGFTLTQLPLGNSPVIDAGSNTAIPADTLDLDGDGDTQENIPADQRRLERLVNDTVDLGAVEVQNSESRELVLDIANVEITEGDGDTNTTLTFTAILNNAPFEQATVEFATTDNVATAGQDYESTEGTLTFEEGETEQTIEVTIFGDNTSESNESFSLELSNPSESLRLANDTVTGTILNDDSGNNNQDPTPAGANVFRFYNTEAGGHFYTTSEQERDFVQEELPQFNFEGTSFLAAQPEDEQAVPVFRFYNTEAGGHFYTTSEQERDMVQELPQFNFEGIGFYAYEEALAETTPVFRFFNTGAGGHFYTPSPEERDFVKEELSQFNFEGTGFYANPVSEA